MITSCESCTLPDLRRCTIIVRQDLNQSRSVFQFRREATSHNIIAIDHTLQKLTLDISVWHASFDKEPLSSLQAYDIHQKAEYDSNVVTILLYQPQAVVLMK